MMKTKKWEVKLEEARQMRKQGAGLLFDRVALLIECYEDDGFRAYHSESGTNELDAMDDELSDVAVDYLTMVAVMKEHPDRDSWIKHNIRDLIALVMEAEAAKRKRDNEEDGKRQSWKQRALAAEAQCERLRAELENMKESLGIVASAKCQ